MTALPRSALLVSVGGDVIAKYGTLSRRLNTAPFGGEGLKETYTNASGGLAAQSDGYYLRSGANVPKIESFSGNPYLLLEAAATNSVPQSNSMATSPWVGGNLTTLANGFSSDPLRGPNYTKIQPDGSSNQHYDALSVTITANENLAAEVWLNGFGGATGARLSVCDTLAQVNGFIVGADLTAGTAVAHQANGTGVLTGYDVTNFGNGNVRIRAWGTIGNGATTATCLLLVYANGAGATSGAAWTGGSVYLFAWGATIERKGSDPLPPSSPIITGAGSATRNADSFTIPFNVACQYGMWIYADLLDRGSGFRTVNSYNGVASLGNSTGAFQIAMRGNSGGQVGAEIWNVANIAGSYQNYAPAIEQRVQVLAMLNAGNLELHLSVAGAPETVTFSSLAGAALPLPWITSSLFINADRVGNIGFAAYKRVLVGLGGGTLIKTIADAAAVPV